MDLFEAIRTTRAMRRLDASKDVSDDDLLAIVEAATKAPSGGNGQPVRWIVVKDPAKRAALGAIYKEAWGPVSQMYQSRQDASISKILTSADHLGEHMGDAPAIVIPCTHGAGDAASVYPAVQNLMLAARALGLGTTLTTVHRLKEDKVREVLGLPDDVTTWAMIPVGYPTGKWGEAERRPVREVAYWDSWKQPPPA